MKLAQPKQELLENTVTKVKGLLDIAQAHKFHPQFPSTVIGTEMNTFTQPLTNRDEIGTIVPGRVGRYNYKSEGVAFFVKP